MTTLLSFLHACIKNNRSAFILDLANNPKWKV